MPQGLSAEIVAQTRAFWHGRTGEPVSDEAAREAIRNLTGFFDLLHKWEEAANGRPGLSQVDTENDKYETEGTVA